MIPCYTNWRNLRYPYIIPLADSEGTEVTLGDHRLMTSNSTACWRLSHRWAGRWGSSVSGRASAALTVGLNSGTMNL